jgi:subtilisin family serine protease
MKIRAVPLLARRRWYALPLALLGLAIAARLFCPRPLPPAPGELPAATVADTVAIHVKLAPSAGPGAASVLATAGAFDIAPLFPRAPALLAIDRIEAIARGGTAAPDLTRWWRLRVDRAAAEAIAAALRARPDVVDAFVEPVLVPADAIGAPGGDIAQPAAGACPIRTPSYEPMQGYLGPAPAGIDAPIAWARAGGRGQGVRFADIEGGWNARHEDLPGDRMQLVAGSPVAGRHWEAHGTAVLGVIAAKANDLGMVGIAPDIDQLVTASIGGLGAAAAIDAAQAALRPGDVLLIELQGTGPRGRFLPVEFWNDVFDAVRVATGRGVIVVAAAGNGGEDLDHRFYRGSFDRKLRDSGAILVGAGGPSARGYTDRARLEFSNFGSRVDVQGWGRGVATLDYGDLQSCSGTERHYTGQFAGTSSASPIVAGAAVLLQGIYKESTGLVLSPWEVRHLLNVTGSPQVPGRGAPLTQNIGPRPDLARALELLDRRISAVRRR